MIDSQKKLVRGAPLRVSARAFNQTIDVANEWQTAKVGRPSSAESDLAVAPALTVMVLLGEAYDVGAIVQFNMAAPEIGSFPDEPLDHNRRPYFSGVTAINLYDPVGVLIDPAPLSEELSPPSGTARAAILGMVTCTVDVLDASHRYAIPTIGDATKLTSAPSGNIRIMQKASGSTGDMLCTVLLQEPPAVGEWVICTGASPTTGLWSGYVLIPDPLGPFNWVPGTEVRMNPHLNPTSPYLELDTLFVEDAIYWCTRNGEVEETGTTYPVFHGHGHRQKIMTVCVDDGEGGTTERCDRWLIPEWLIEEDVECPEEPE